MRASRPCARDKQTQLDQSDISLPFSSVHLVFRELSPVPFADILLCPLLVVHRLSFFAFFVSFRCNTLFLLRPTTMGMETAHFVDEPPDFLVCPRCDHVMNNPVVACDDGHSFCHDCVSQLDKCPIDHQELCTKFVKNRVVEEMIQHLPVYCAHSNPAFWRQQGETEPTPVTSTCNNVGVVGSRVTGQNRRATACARSHSITDNKSNDRLHHQQPQQQQQLQLEPGSISLYSSVVANHNHATSSSPHTRNTTSSAITTPHANAIAPNIVSMNNNANASTNSSPSPLSSPSPTFSLFSSSSFSPSAAFSPSSAIVSALSQFCDWKGPFRELHKHLHTNCPLHPSSCRFASKGCSTVLPRCQLAHHEDTCEFREVPCPTCQHMFLAKDMASHVTRCPLKHTLCDQCGQRVRTPQELAAHKSRDCPEEMVACELAALGCRERVKRRETAKHATEFALR